jgi:hypothetical protein
VQPNDSPTFVAVNAGDVNITGPTPVLTLTDNDTANEYTKIQNSSGATFINSRNGTANGAIILSGQGGGVSDEYARFDASGNFGIGTTSPSSTLHVNSGGTNNVATFESTDGTATIKFVDSNQTTNVVLGAKGNDFYVQTGGAEKLRILDSGNVGIGTNTPATALDVTGTVTATAFSGGEVVGSISTGTLDLSTGNVFSDAPSANATYVFSNPPASGTAYGFTLKITPSATVTVTWPTSVDWAAGTAPDAPASGTTSVFVFYTQDGGTTYYGFLAGEAMA